VPPLAQKSHDHFRSGFIRDRGSRSPTGNVRESITRSAVAEVGDCTVQLALHTEDRSSIEMSQREVALASLTGFDDLRAAVDGLCGHFPRAVTEHVGPGWGYAYHQRKESCAKDAAGRVHFCTSGAQRMC